MDKFDRAERIAYNERLLKNARQFVENGLYSLEADGEVLEEIDPSLPQEVRIKQALESFDLSLHLTR